MERLADDIITGARAISEETGFGVRTVYKLSDRREIPTFKVGGILCARRSELRKRLSADTE